MSTFEAILLGIVQGLTEFLPVSSSGHLVLFQNWLGLSEPMVAFDVAVHLGTVLSIFTIYYKPLVSIFNDVVLFVKDRKPRPGATVFFLVFLGSIPTAIIGLGFKKYFELMFGSTLAVGSALIVTGFLLLMTRNARHRPTEHTLRRPMGSPLEVLIKGQKTKSLLYIDKLTWIKAIAIGFAQGLAITPGISRSGTTISIALILGVDRHMSALFSFLLAIPAVLGASILELSKVSWESGTLKTFGIGFVTAYIFGVIGLWLVLKLVKYGRLEVFTPYLWLIGAWAIFQAI